MISIIKAFGHYWVALEAIMYRRGDYMDRPTGVSRVLALDMTAEDIGQLLGGN